MALSFFSAASTDYVETTETVVFFPGSPSQMCVTIPLLNDDVFESQEFFAITLENVDGTMPTVPTTASVLVLDDDSEH